jgi:hypothetical protein
MKKPTGGILKESPVSRALILFNNELSILSRARVKTSQLFKENMIFQNAE